MFTLGIILAAGRSSRLFPATLVTTKQVLPIYDKPLIYYPLSTLMLAGVRDFLIICNPKEKPIFEELFYDSENTLGIKINIAVQDYPAGIADTFNIVNEECLIEYDRYALILGDNIFYGGGFSELLWEASDITDHTYCFLTRVPDPHRFGIAEIDDAGKIISIEEKPSNPKSNLAITGLYFFPSDVLDRIRKLQPSARGELEITDILKTYMGQNLIGTKMWRGVVWFDAGTPNSMIEASNFVRTIQQHQELLIGSPHEIAYNKCWITADQLKATALLCKNSDYGVYLEKLHERK